MCCSLTVNQSIVHYMNLIVCISDLRTYRGRLSYKPYVGGKPVTSVEYPVMERNAADRVRYSHFLNDYGSWSISERDTVVA